MEPINGKTQSPVPPTSYEDYLELCQSRGIDPQLDKPMFESALEDRRIVRIAFGNGEQENEGDSSNYLQGLSNEQILRKLGVALHLDELISTTKNS